MFASATLLLLASSAQAGGIGIFGTGGVHTEKLYYYSNVATVDGQSVPIADPADYPAFDITEILPSAGGGLELVLGDRDEKINGTFRFWAWADLPQVPAAEVVTDLAPENVVEAPRDTTRAIGMGMVGLNFGLIGDPDAALFGFTAHMGSGFLTTDHTEFLMADIGPQASYALTPAIRLTGDVVYTMRHRKGFSHGVNAYVGARYMFD